MYKNKPFKYAEYLNIDNTASLNNRINNNVNVTSIINRNFDDAINS